MRGLCTLGIVAVLLAGCGTPIGAAGVISLWALTQSGHGLPDRREREWGETAMRVCAVSGVTDPDADLRGCVIRDVNRRNAALVEELQGRQVLR